MKIRRLIIFIALLLLVLPSIELAAETKYVEGFSGSKVDSFPRGWRAKPGQGSAGKTVYHVKEDGGNNYLAADDENGLSVQIFKLAHWDLGKYPILKWRWRARKLPAGANETVPSKNDSACGIYVSFGMIRGQALKYVWSTSVPAGTFYKKNDKMYIIVKRSGSGSLGRWVNESTNVIEDAKKAFGKVPDRTLSGVAILTDGNATHSPAACDYDSIGYASLPQSAAEKTAD